MDSADVTLTPDADGTYTVLARATSPNATRRETVRRRLVAANFSWFLGFDPKSPADRAEVERRIGEFAGTDITIAWKD